jgi:cell division protein FtsW
LSGKEKRRSTTKEKVELPASFYILIGITVIMSLIGLVMVFSASQATGLAEYQDSFYYFKKQILWMVIGFAALILLAKTDHRWLRRLSYPGMGISIILLIAVLIPGIGIIAGGARRWIMIGPFNVQPSEIAKLAMVLFCAVLLSGRQEKIHDPKFLLIPIVPLLCAVSLLVVIQPDLGTTLIIAMTVFIILFAAGARLTHLFNLVAPAALAVAVIINRSPYMLERLLSFIHPEKDPTGSGFQIIQSKIALGSGHIFGVGLGLSKQKFFYLPAAHTDFILAIIGEEFGLIGTMFVLALFMILGFIGIRIALKAPTYYGRILAAGITSLIVLQATINMGAVTGIMPITGVPLPFISFGGTSLLFTLMGVGILLKIASQEGRVKEGVIDARHYFRRRDRRTSVSGDRPRKQARVS